MSNDPKDAVIDYSRLRKQNPVKYSKQLERYEQIAYEGGYIIDYKCPKCGCRLLSRTVDKHVAGSCYSYCFMCGQHIDWEGVR